MTTVQCIMELCSWLEENVCSDVVYKKPAAAGAPTDGGYAWTMVNPSVFPFSIPTSQRNPDEKSQCPCIAVVVREASDDLPDLRSFDVDLNLFVWNPGDHPGDWIAEDPDHPGYYTQDKSKDKGYQQSMCGWHDLFNFIDHALEKLESVNSIGGLRLVRESPIKSGPAIEGGKILQTWPIFVGYISFQLEGRIFRNNQELMDLL